MSADHMSEPVSKKLFDSTHWQINWCISNLQLVHYQLLVLHAVFNLLYLWSPLNVKKLWSVTGNVERFIWVLEFFIFFKCHSPAGLQKYQAAGLLQPFVVSDGGRSFQRVLHGSWMLYTGLLPSGIKETGPNGVQLFFKVAGSMAKTFHRYVSFYLGYNKLDICVFAEVPVNLCVRK